MSTITIPVPRDYTLQNSLDFGQSLMTYPEADECIIDFQVPGWVTPFGMLFVSSAIQCFRQAHPTTAFTAINYNNAYARHMGFFQACGFDIGKSPGEADGSERYLPITIIRVCDLVDQAKQEFTEVGNVIEKRSEELALVLTQQDKGSINEMMSYTLREMFRNVIEHSQSDSLAYCAQFMPTRYTAEIAIFDAGVGIRQSLSNNPYLKLENDRQALNCALMPGISGKTFRGVKRDAYNVWQNSGYGLYAVSRLCGFGGKFLICSGDTGLSLTPKGKETHLCSYQGTALRLNLYSKDITQLQTVLSRIMKEGDEIAKKMDLDAPSPSVASRWLTDEFKGVKR